MAKSKNQKTKKFLLLPLFLLPMSSALALAHSHTHEQHKQTRERKWGKKGLLHHPQRLQRRRSSHRVLLLKLLPYRIRYRAIPISFLFSLTTLSSSSCVAFWKSLIFRPPERIIIIIVFRNAVSYFNIIG